MDYEVMKYENLLEVKNNNKKVNIYRSLATGIINANFINLKDNIEFSIDEETRVFLNHQQFFGLIKAFEESTEIPIFINKVKKQIIKSFKVSEKIEPIVFFNEIEKIVPSYNLIFNYFNIDTGEKDKESVLIYYTAILHDLSHLKLRSFPLFNKLAEEWKINNEEKYEMLLKFPDNLDQLYKERLCINDIKSKIDEENEHRIKDLSKKYNINEIEIINSAIELLKFFDDLSQTEKIFITNNAQSNKPELQEFKLDLSKIYKKYESRSIPTKY